MFRCSFCCNAARLLVPALLLIFFFGGCAAPHSSREPAAPPPSAANELAGLLGQRLQLAEKVAWVKFREGLPVEDRAREKDFLAAVEVRATAAGFCPMEARRFFAAQIEASKREQRRLLGAWNRGQPLPDWGAVSLRHDVRPELDRLTPAFLASWHAARTRPGLRRELYRDLREQGWSIPVARAAVSF